MSDVRTTEARASSFADLATLLKLRIAVFVGFAAFVGGAVAADPTVTLSRVLEASLWTTLSAGAASVFNQVLERDSDRRMRRTSSRPLPAGRVSMRDAVLLGAALAVVAIAMLAWRFNVLSALLALGTMFAYVAIYTPLKRASSLNTLVGALPGAAPPLVGFAAIAGAVHGWAWVLFAFVYVWQFPHFFAIAWLYRDDYARAGMQMLPSVAGGEAVAGRTAFAHALALVPVSCLPGAMGDASLGFTLAALALALWYAHAALGFARKSDDASARRLLRVSLVYLPLVLVAVLCDPRAGALDWLLR